jgi:hypothetical protein
MSKYFQNHFYIINFSHISCINIFNLKWICSVLVLFEKSKSNEVKLDNEFELESYWQKKRNKSKTFKKLMKINKISANTNKK